MNLMLNCLCCLFLLPYGMVCALFGIKNLLDPWFTDEVWGPTAPPQLNPRIFLFEMNGIMSEIMGVAPLPYSKVEGAILLLGAVGAFGSWILYPAFFYFCNYLLLFSGMYFALVIPYAVLTQQSEIAPVMLLCLMLCLVTTAIRAFIIADDPYDAPPYTSALVFFGLLLLVMSVAQTFVISRNAAKVEDSIAKFHAIKQHFLGNGMVWSKGKQYPAGYLDENALLRKA